MTQSLVLFVQNHDDQRQRQTCFLPTRTLAYLQAGSGWTKMPTVGPLSGVVYDAGATQPRGSSGPGPTGGSEQQVPSSGTGLSQLLSIISTSALAAVAAALLCL